MKRYLMIEGGFIVDSKTLSYIDTPSNVDLSYELKISNNKVIEMYHDFDMYPYFEVEYKIIAEVDDLSEFTKGINLMTKPEKFKKLCEEISDLYARKNKDYGDSFGISISKYGPIAGLTRISDKFNRLENLMLTKEQQVKDESVKDTLLDLASYSLMLYIELESGE